MRVLLDECLDESLRLCFSGHECQTCRYAGLKGLTNGRLLSAAEQAGFEVLITVDQNLPRQQKIEGRRISVIVLRSLTTDFDDLLPLIPEVLKTLQSVKAGSVIRIGFA
jgi:predicted nuclease of predicted toxin-antitoxin system